MRKIQKKSTIIFITVVVMAMAICLIRFMICTPSKQNVQGVNTNLIVASCESYEWRFGEMASNVDFLIHSENICKKGVKERNLFQKTDWILIDGSQKDLCMYGGFNYAKWYFLNSTGRVITVINNENLYNDFLDSTLKNKSYDTVSIPRGSVAVQVVYHKQWNRWFAYAKNVVYKLLHLQLEDAWNEIKMIIQYYEGIENDDLYIVYGKAPVGHIKSVNYSIPISEVTAGSSVKYMDGKWKMVDAVGDTTLLNVYDLSVGMSVSVRGGHARFSSGSPKKICCKDDTIYGVRIARESSSIVCERVAGAKGLHSNYLIGNEYAFPYKNDFDDIYPWSGIKECYMTDDGTVSYIKPQDENYNYMVEVPIFYSKRVLVENDEYIYISKTMQDGFFMEPAFITNEGVVDKIYVSAFHASIQNGEIGSYEGTIPLINMSLKDINLSIEKKGNNWSEIDIATINMLQRLWLIETSVKNTQSIFSGYTESTFIWSNDTDPKYAIRTAYGSNTIDIKRNKHTSHLSVGDAVVVLSYEKKDRYSAYLFFSDKYVNDDSNWQRYVTKVENNGLELRISFTGDPVDITAGSTIIANLPEECGVTNGLIYHTGEEVDITGKKSFKYRGMENLWGNVCVILGGAYCKDRELFLEQLNGERRKTSIVLPEQNIAGGVARSYECAVKSMLFDDENPLLMLPGEISDGATLSNSYGDWFATPESDFMLREGEERYLTYGMTWDLANYAGLFAYRVQPAYDSHRVENGARIIYR